MSDTSIGELDPLNGELVPERTDPSAVSPFHGGGGDDGHGGDVALSHGSDRGPTVLSARQAVDDPPLLGLLGGGNSPACVPAAVAD